jgi:hypothetical protein
MGKIRNLKITFAEAPERYTFRVNRSLKGCQPRYGVHAMGGTKRAALDKPFPDLVIEGYSTRGLAELH